MIKINLLPQKRAKRAVGGRAQVARTGDTGSRDLLIGVMGLLGAGALVFLILDMPKRGELADAKTKKEALTAELKRKQTDPKISVGDFDTLTQQQADAIKKIQATRRLMETRIVPANILHELGQILTVRGPTMSIRMSKVVDSEKRIQYDWDPTHVWLTAFRDTAGTFSLEGGAQSKEDVTQLQKRLAASIYFLDVTPSGGEQVIDKDTGLAYYKFTITGKVVY